MCAPEDPPRGQLHYCQQYPYSYTITVRPLSDGEWIGLHGLDIVAA